MNLALASRCLNLPLREAVKRAAEFGAGGVQFDAREELKPGDLTETGRRQFLHGLDELGLKVASLMFPTRRTFYDEELLDARVAGAKAAMDFAWELRAKVLTARVGRIPAEKDSQDYVLLREVLSDLAQYGNHVGVTFTMTPMGDSPQVIGELIGAVKTGPLGVDFDPAAFVMGGQNPVDAFRVLHGSILHVQGRDAIRDIDAGGQEVELGRGEVDWIELLPLLDEIAYGGWVTVNRTSGSDRAGDAARAIRYLKNVGMERG